MAYTMLKNKVKDHGYDVHSFEGAALSFIRNRCEGLRFDPDIDESDGYKGRSIKEDQIPYNMEKDIDRLCLENAIDRFLGSGKKEDAFDVYFCYLEMFVGDYEKTRRDLAYMARSDRIGTCELNILDIEAEYERMAGEYGVDKERVKSVYEEELITDNKKLDMARELIRDTGIAEKSAQADDGQKTE